MWTGGQPGRNTGDAKSYYGPVIENLRELLRLNLGALDPNNPKKEHRLSDRALSRVLHDIISRRMIQPWWFGVGWPWDSLRNCARIVQREVKEAKVLREGTYQEPTAPAYDERKLERAGWTHFMFSDATFAARGPGKVRAFGLGDDGTEKKPLATTTSVSETASVPAVEECSTPSATKRERSSQFTNGASICVGLDLYRQGLALGFGGSAFRGPTSFTGWSEALSQPDTGVIAPTKCTRSKGRVAEGEEAPKSKK
ncbi:hypothetical protein PPTG_11703 [Phytophthora nicotianae INRA-310]|uniref:Uncharacterized protein n=1 Tax=Phytophthora nicotianae (strain INRA-310) TaxID=761204 RepID=W2Q8M5_PHYN3|nr:hypothetical protein PPTG_11703 [Phytophthora nicotianae INRA-310]ETN08894.1 hypothetical protein PPTG_11703 [Phytophthora nicotianae INRA-310]